MDYNEILNWYIDNLLIKSLVLAGYQAFWYKLRSFEEKKNNNVRRQLDYFREIDKFPLTYL